MDDPILQKFISIILRHDPSVSLKAVVPYYDGHDHYVFVVNKTITS